MSLMIGGVSAGEPASLASVRVSDAAFKAAIALFRRHFSRGLSFTDCTTLASMGERRVGFVASFDRGFDGLAARVEA